MSKEKVESLIKYIAQMKAKLEAPVPPKHVNRAEQYKAFLQREIKTTKLKLDEATVK